MTSRVNLRELIAELVQATGPGARVDIWVLVTSCPVVDQHATALEELARRQDVEILILDLDSSRQSRFVVLMAAYPVLVERWAADHGIAFTMPELTSALAQIAGSPEFQTSYERLLLKLRSTLLGFEDARRRAARLFLEVVKDQGNAIAVFNQRIAVRSNEVHNIRRPNIERDLDEWYSRWKTTHDHAVLVGEEGTGKTWVVMGWIAALVETDNAPIVLPFSAFAESFGLDETVETLLPRLLCKWTGMGNSESWMRRLKRWLSAAESSRPLILLVADGLSERPNTAWPSFFRTLEHQEWRDRVAILATDRPAHWDSSCAASGLGKFRRLEVGGYTDEELRQSLDGSEISIKNIPDELQVLVRKPRYCSLATKYFKEMQADSDFTVERLILLDIRHRTESKRGQLTEDAFVELIRSLALKHRENPDLTLPVIQALIPFSDPDRRIQQEIIDGGFLVRRPGLSSKFAVEPARLVFGLGMLLADELRSLATEGKSQPEIEQALTSWFEPHPEMDLKVKICGAALFHSLVEASYPTFARRELLRYWLALRNWDDRVQRAFIDYIVRCPDDFIAVADEVWSLKRNLGAAQDFLTTAFLKYRDDSRVQPSLSAAVGRWMSFLHPAGSSSQRGTDREGRVRHEIEERVGHPLLPGSTQLCGENIVVVKDDGMMRLIRLGFLIISAGDRGPYIRSLIPWAVASAAMGDGATRSLADWVVRLAEVGTEGVLQREMERLLDRNEPLSDQAAHVLHWRIHPGKARIQRREQPCFQTEQWRLLNEQYERDPCRSFIPWTDADCQKCMDRKDVAATAIIQRVGSRLFDPDFKVPGAVVERTSALLQFDHAAFRSGIWSTEEDYNYDSCVPLLASRGPLLLASFVRSVIRTLPARPFEKLYPAALWMPAFSLVLGQEEIDIALRLARELREDNGGDDKEKRDRCVAEAFLLLSASPWLTPRALLSRLLERPYNAFDLRQFEVWFCSLPDEVAGQAVGMIHSHDDLAVSRLLWFLGGSPTELSGADRDRLIQLAQSNNPTLRATALRFACLGDDQQLARRIIDLGISYREQVDAAENVWGARLLIRHSQNLAFESVCARVNEADAGYALRLRAFPHQDVRIYGELLDRRWKEIVAAPEPQIASLPAVEFEESESLYGSEFPRFQEPASFRVTFKDSLHTWANHRSEDTRREVFETLRELQDTDKQAEHRNRLSRDNADALLAAWQTEAYQWFARDFSSSALAHVCQAMPETASTWVASLLQDDTTGRPVITRLATFLERLCPALLEHDPPVGLRLWKYLFGEAHHPFLFGAAHACFSAPNNLAAEEARGVVMDSCFDDAAISHVALAAEMQHRREWLTKEIARMIAAPELWKRARGLTLASFSDISPEQFEAYCRQAMVSDSWVQDQIPHLRANILNNHFAKRWFGLFLANENADESWGALQMMLLCADRRFYVWRKLHENHGAKKLSYRLRFLDSQNSEIEKALDRDEVRRGTLFGIKIEAGEIYPFLGASGLSKTR